MIEKCLQAGDSYQEIGRRLGRGKSTVCEEVSVNGGREHYDAKKAQHRSYLKQWRKKRGCLKVPLDPFLYRHVEKEVREWVSPERIAGRLKLEGKPYASPKAIRKFAKTRCLEHLFYRARVRPKGKHQGPVHWENRVFVDTVVREGPGHWEGDFIVSSKSDAVLFVGVERTSKHTVVLWLPNRNNDLVNQAVVSALSPYRIASLTVDNDVAFVKHEQLASMLHAPVYFARPYRSTDKPLVENTNRWIRQFVPKKTNLSSVTAATVERIETWLNDTPRQCLNFHTARETMELLQKLGCSY